MKINDYKNQANKQIRGILKSFYFAVRGFAFCVINERNMRIHICVAAFALILSRFYSFTKTEYILLFIAVMFVVITEMINTAFETLVNMQVSRFDNFAKIAKDVAAGAVLMSAAFALIIGILLFLDISKIKEMFSYIFARGWLVGLFIAFFAASVAFIFFPGSLVRRKKTKFEEK